ncbi:metallophosphoesterase [candidate division WWE3 bacterium CG_4_10_14_0_2_um_filter_41_14]|uniref:Phosphoesterase n=1 Tax=candidate division WWE3 bacterium CG_4_10_14_0_2_um_filter_41_14 TaxID=1975072 RepID=A0A2M7THP1_UNCKA|nr:MAG: metallophosphoesterase [candidate division WWE3 bacterium CG_4_10_14_0_2_um_filter_41_14]
MKISILSDSHDNWINLDRAVAISNEQGCEYALFAGDLIAPPQLAILEKFNGKVYFVWGNNEAEKVGMTRMMDASEKIELSGDIYEGEIDGVKVFMNHYPRISELAAKSGEFDLCIHGHTHEYRQEKIGETILINPGEVQGFKTGVASFVVFDTVSKQVEKIVL